MTSTQTHPLETTLQGELLSHAQGTFIGANQIELFYQSWYPASGEAVVEGHTARCDAVSAGSLKNSPEAPLSTGEASSASQSAQSNGRIKGVLAIVHGLGEHSGRYCSIVNAAVSEGYAVFGFDNQGHGQSEGQRGHINRWQDYRDNVQAFLQLVRQQEPNAPLCVMGHSMGGLIVLDYVLRCAQTARFKALNISRLIVSAPPMKPTKTNPLKAILARLLSGFFPRFTLKMCLDEGGLSRDRQVESQTQKDPLVHSYVTLRWGAEAISTIAWVKQHVGELKLPIMLTHGSADPIIDPVGSTDLFKAISAPEKTLRIYPGSYHEPHNDLDSSAVTKDIVGWLDQIAEA